ncbi:MAG: alternative ribosome rescue aminoacyl-tRNA hydrolase ArfB [Acidimicrobiia bacterium]
MSAERRFRISPTVVIPFEELEFRVDTSGGPGGQHANVTRSRVEVRFDVAASRGLGDRAKELVIERIGPVVRAAASDARSQSRNRELALERLRERLEGALRVDRPRRPTKPSAGARKKRVEQKKRRGEVKRDRRRPHGDE